MKLLLPTTYISSMNKLTPYFDVLEKQSINSSKVHIFWEGHKILGNLHLTFVLCTVPVKSMVEISQNFVAFSEYMNLYI